MFTLLAAVILNLIYKADNLFGVMSYFIIMIY